MVRRCPRPLSSAHLYPRRAYALFQFPDRLMYPAPLLRIWILTYGTSNRAALELSIIAYFVSGMTPPDDSVKELTPVAWVTPLGPAVLQIMCSANYYEYELSLSG